MLASVMDHLLTCAYCEKKPATWGASAVTFGPRSKKNILTWWAVPDHVETISLNDDADREVTYAPHESRFYWLGVQYR